MDILIITIPGDVHAHAAIWALGRLGRVCRRWFPSDLAGDPALLRLSDPGFGVHLSGPDGPIDGRSVDTVWLRRFRVPEIPESLPEGDRVIAKRESESFLRGLNFALGNEGDVFWANTPAAQRVASLKTPQLVAAQQVGLKVPRTLMTNDMDEVRAFFRAAHGRIIYKGFLPAVWEADSSQYVLQTVLVDEHMLEDTDSLRLSPGIFQEFIPKKYELRVTVFGQTIVAAQITDQDEVDWRTTHKMKLTPYTLPAAVADKVLALMKRLGLAMGTIDMIVNAEGEYVFLEVNEQGQFLWVEEMNPEIRVLDPFARFLAAGRADFQWQPQEELRFGDYLASPAFTAFRAQEQLKRSSAGNVIVKDS
ncbi:MAG TPA: hypothetical protein VH877_17610 [Polyangia bacterium]|nr:hypothetical protein [Polyangia bacterium]